MLFWTCFRALYHYKRFSLLEIRTIHSGPVLNSWRNSYAQGQFIPGIKERKPTHIIVGAGSAGCVLGDLIIIIISSYKSIYINFINCHCCNFLIMDIKLRIIRHCIRNYRWSSSKAYLHPILSRPNLFTSSGITCTRVLFDKNKAIGVEFIRLGRKLYMKLPMKLKITNIQIFLFSISRMCIRMARELFATKAFDPYRGSELAPGSDVQSDASIDKFVRAKAASAYHPSCTCKMGSADDRTSVVDPKTMNVYGTENLKVVDASVMPSIVSGNLNAPTIMLAERAADLIQGRTMPASCAPVWSHKQQ
uniref:GMC_oxred_C domain-containing protein n=1 Tax=Heterorhabditis bacteriophora TaxID=37862 RepID=A0A1I7X9R0_HETBA